MENQRYDRAILHPSVMGKIGEVVQEMNKIVVIAFYLILLAIGIGIIAAYGDSDVHDLVSYNFTIDCKNIEYSTNQTLNMIIMKHCIGKGGEGEND